MEPAADLAAQLVDLSGRGEYLRAASEMLVKLIPGVGVGWASVDFQTGEVEISNFPDLPSVSRDAFMRYSGDHPLVRAYLLGASAPQGILRLSDLISDRGLRETSAYREALRPAGVDRQLSIRVSDPGKTGLRAWAMNRSGSDFADADLEIAGALQPTLQLLDLAYAPPNSPESTGRAEAYSLTAREEEILQLLGKGLTGVAIGHLLGISPRTVAKHLEHAYAKLGCTNRIDALRVLRGD